MPLHVPQHPYYPWERPGKVAPRADISTGSSESGSKELLPGAILVAFVVFLSSFAGAKKFAMKDTGFHRGASARRVPGSSGARELGSQVKSGSQSGTIPLALIFAVLGQVFCNMPVPQVTCFSTDSIMTAWPMMPFLFAILSTQTWRWPHDGHLSSLSPRCHELHFVQPTGVCHDTIVCWANIQASV